MQVVAAALDAAGWAAVVDSVLAVAAEDPLQQLAPAPPPGDEQMYLQGAFCSKPFVANAPAA